MSTSKCATKFSGSIDTKPASMRSVKLLSSIKFSGLGSCEPPVSLCQGKRAACAAILAANVDGRFIAVVGERARREPGVIGAVVQVDREGGRRCGNGSQTQ